LEIDVLMHHREACRPSSTGHLINRLIPGSRHHVWRRERRLQATDIQVPGRELWILHPQGMPLPAEFRPGQVQVVLLDGSWRETAAIAHEVRTWGRTIALPMAGPSRYWLRAQTEAGRCSTVEALMFLLTAGGLHDAALRLHEQFELHVYAGLRARGQKILSEEFLATSPIRTAFPAFLAQMNVRRPLRMDPERRD
jgi:DTW domain-containing protein YfiP